MNPDLYTVVEYAEHRAAKGYVGKTGAAVRKAIKSGRIPVAGKDDRGKDLLDPLECDLAWEQNTRPRTPAKSPSGAGKGRETLASRRAAPAAENEEGLVDLATAKLRREWYSAELARVKFEQAEGRLVELEEVEKELAEIGRLLREKLSPLGLKLSGVLVGRTDAGEVARIHEDEVEEVLGAIADRLEEVRDRASGDDGEDEAA